MIVKFLEIFTEYAGIILCMHKAAGKRIRISRDSLLHFTIYMTLMYVSKNISFFKLALYAYLFAYTRIRVADTWKQAVKAYAVTMCAMPIVQLLIYGVISDALPDMRNMYLWGIIVNTLIIIFLTVWKEKHLFALIDIVTRFRKIIFLILLMFLLKSLVSYYSEYKVIDSYYIDQIVVCFFIVSLMLILWISSENEKRHKAEELRAYQLYAKTFEDAVAAIRTKQHEFDNHINAIKCMQYAIHDTEKLIEEQNKYCDRVLQDNRYNKLLKLNASPILIGYLYSKFSAASAHNINVEYEIQDIDIEAVLINDLIEIIGILFDNAVEALEHHGDKEIEVRLMQNDNRFVVSVANRSGRKTNSEIEKFFAYGYSTKGSGRGAGLHRAASLLKKYKAYIQVENISRCGVNYLRFQVTFGVKKASARALV